MDKEEKAVQTFMNDPDKFLDVLYLNKLVDLVGEVMSEGYGEVVFKITVKNGAVKILTITKTNTIDVESLAQKR